MTKDISTPWLAVLVALFAAAPVASQSHKDWSVHHANVDNGDVVSIGKRIVLTFEDDTLEPWDPFCIVPGGRLEWRDSASRSIDFICRYFRNLDGKLRLILAPKDPLQANTQYSVLFAPSALRNAFRRQFTTLRDGERESDYVVPMPEVDATPIDGQYLTAVGSRNRLGFDLEYDVYLPPGYSRRGSSQRYPLVLALHGLTSNYTVWKPTKEHLDKAIQQGWIEPIIVVFPDGMVGWTGEKPWEREQANQHEICTVRNLNAPRSACCQTHFVTTQKNNDTFGFAENTVFSDFLADTFIPQLRKEYRIRGGVAGESGYDPGYLRLSTGVGGYSMGGYGALMNAFIHPEAYGSVVALSPEGVALPSWLGRIVGWTSDGPEFDGLSAEASCLQLEADGEVPPRAKTFRCLGLAERLDYFGWPLLADGWRGDLAFWVDSDPSKKSSYDKIRAGGVYDFAGNIYFSAPICDGKRGDTFHTSSLNAMDLDCVLDRGNIAHTFKLYDYWWPGIHERPYFRYHIQHGDFFRFFNSVFDELPQSYDESKEEKNPEVLLDPTKAPVEKGDAARHLYFNDPYTYMEGREGLPDVSLDDDRDGRVFLPDRLDYDAARPYGDNCPEIYNPDQRDENDDGVGDACSPVIITPPLSVYIGVAQVYFDISRKLAMEMAARILWECGDRLSSGCLSLDVPIIIIEDPVPYPVDARPVLGGPTVSDDLRFELGVALAPSLRLTFRPEARFSGSIFVGGGLMYRKGDTFEAPGLGTVTLDSSTHPLLTFGGGLSYRLGPRTSLQLQVRVLSTLSNDLTLRPQSGQTILLREGDTPTPTLSFGVIFDFPTARRPASGPRSNRR